MAISLLFFYGSFAAHRSLIPVLFMNSFHSTLIVNIVATLFMVGVIWFVQIVHYPLFQLVGPEQFAEYEQRHQSLTTFVVLPPMVAELITAALLCLRRSEALPTWMPIAGLLLVIIIWLLTFTMQVPLHGQLAGGYDEQIAKRLVAGNWFRTWAWTLRGILVVWMAAYVMVE